MITIQDGLPAHVVVAKASGTVTAEDYERTLIPAVDAAAAGGQKLRMLYDLGEEFEGYEAEAALDDTKLGLRHWNDFERVAMVTDHEGYRMAVKAFGFLIPGQVRVYPTSERDAATEWITGD
jgi:hypothetical protein